MNLVITVNLDKKEISIINISQVSGLSNWEVLFVPGERKLIIGQFFRGE